MVRFIEDLLPICIQSARSCSMLLTSGVGAVPSGFSQTADRQTARSLASDLFTAADGETFIRFAVRVTAELPTGQELQGRVN